MNKTLLLFFFLVLQFTSWAQETAYPEFETDRPDRTETASIVPGGFYQLETGFQYQKNRQDGAEKRELLYPQALLRIDILKKAELRLEGTFRRNDFLVQRQLRDRNRGLSNVRVGTKINLWEESGLLPMFSVMAMVELPWGVTAYKTDKVAPEIRLLFSNQITQKLKLEYNLGYRREKEEGDMESKIQYAVSLSREVSDKLSLFAEFFGDKPKGSRGENQVDGGIQYKLLPNLQVDVIAGTRVSSEAPEMFLGGGLSFRLPR